MRLEEIVLELREKILPRLTAQPLAFSFPNEEGREKKRYYPLIYSGVGVGEEYDTAFRQGYPEIFEEDFLFTITRAKADIASHFATPENPVQEFSYDSLRKTIIDLHNLRDFFRDLKLEAETAKGRYQLFNKNAGFFGMNSEIMGVLRSDNPEYTLENIPENQVLRARLKSFGIGVRDNDQDTDIVKALIKRYYEKLNILDTFQTTSVDNNWKTTIETAQVRMLEYLREGGEFPVNEANLLLDSDQKHPLYLSRTGFAKAIIDEFSFKKSYFILLFDAKKLNNMNRKHMERVSMELYDIFSESGEFDMDRRIRTDMALANLLRPVDDILYRYNTVIRDEVVQFLFEQGFSEADFRGFLGGDETIVGLPVNMYKYESKEDALADIQKLVKRIEGRIKKSDFKLFGQQLEFRLGLADCQVYNYGHHIGSDFFVEDYSETITRADEGSHMAKTGKNNYPVFVTRKGNVKKNTRVPGLRITESARPYDYEKYRNTETSNETANHNSLKYNMRKGDLDPVTNHFRRTLNDLPSKQIKGKKNVVRVIMAGRGNYNTRNEDITEIFLGVKDINTMFGFQTTNNWISNVGYNLNEMLGSQVEGRSGKFTYLVE